MIRKLTVIFIYVFAINICQAKTEQFNPYAADLKDAFMAAPLKVCVDNNDSYPYYFSQDNELVGIHIDIISKAIVKENIGFSLVLSNFATCLELARSGEVGAVLDVAYTQERANYMKYPENTDIKQASIANPIYKKFFEKHAIGTFDYVVVTSSQIDNIYEFNGDPTSLPVPIRVVKDYAIIEYLEAFNLQLIKNKSSSINFEDLANNSGGCIIDLRSVANSFNQQAPIKNQFRISSELIFRENLYLGFSKKAKISNKQVARIWDNIEELKTNPKYMRMILKKYNQK